jgi:hypothetical protein
VVGAVVFALLAPIGLAALPLAALLAVSRPATIREWAVLGTAGGFAVAWLLGAGSLPDQAARAAAVLATAGFTLATVRTRWAFTHRALLALAVQAAGVTLLLGIVGSSWGEMVWWVEHDLSMALRAPVAAAWSLVGSADTGSWLASQFEDGIGSSIRVVSDLYPTVTAVQLLAGLALATAVYQRVAAHPRGRPMGRLRDFRFSEHLGWLAVLPLVALIVPRLAAAKFAAQNLVAVAAALYALRGVAVAVVGVELLGAGGGVLALVSVLVGILLLPVVLGGAILLGVLDAGLDLRRRWAHRE